MFCNCLNGKSQFRIRETKMCAKKLLSLTILIISLLLNVLGCIPIDDLANHWEKGVIDPNLQGSWKGVGSEFATEDQCFTLTKADGYYNFRQTGLYMPANSPDHRCKTLIIGNHKFLMFCCFKKKKKKLIFLYIF